jgi:hypothetical protein
MGAVITNSVVGLAVAVALLYSVWRLGPAALRRAVLDRLSVVFPALANRSAGSACESCGSCAPSKPPAKTNTEPKASPLHFVPPSKLRR